MAQADVLRRKTGTAAAPGLAAMTPARALGFALAKAADEALGVGLSVDDVTIDEAATEDLAEGLPELGLFVLLRAQDLAPGVAMPPGLAVLCPQALGAVIEARTMGKVLAQPAVERAATATDAAMAQGWLDAGLAGLSAFGTDCDEVPGPRFATGERQAGSAGLRLVMADVPHRRFKVTVSFADGAKTGTLWLIFPASVRSAGAGALPDAEAWRMRLERSVLSTPARLEAVLCRMPMQIADVTKLQPGDVLPLGPAQVDGVALIGPGGRRVAGARLGRSGLSRAVRVRIETDGALPPPQG